MRRRCLQSPAAPGSYWTSRGRCGQGCFSGSFSAGLLGVPQPWQTARGGFLLLLAVCWGGEVTSIPARNWELNLQCDFSGSRFQLLVLKHFSLVN